MGILKSTLNKWQTGKERRDAEKQAYQAATTGPAGYQSQYADRITDAVKGLNDRSVMGVAEASTGDRAAAQDRVEDWMQEAARQGQAGTAALSGGFDTGYAGAAAAQTAERMAQAQRIAADRAAYGRALEAYDADTAAGSAALAGLMGQEITELSRYADREGQRRRWGAYLDGREQTAVQQNQLAEQDRQDAWQRALQAAKWAVQTGMDAYDTYKGYTQQEWENAFRMQQYNDAQAWQQKQFDASTAQYNQQARDAWIEAARSAYEKGDMGSAQYYLSLAGQGEDFFSGYRAAPTTDLYQLAMQAAGLKGQGMKDAAAALLGQYGYDSSLIAGYNPYAGKVSGGGTGGGGGSTGGGLSFNQQSTAYSNYQKALASGDQQGAAYWGGMLGFDNTGTGYQTDARTQRGYTMASDWKKAGVSQDTVALRLLNQGFGEQEVLSIMRQAGY